MEKSKGRNFNGGGGKKNKNIPMTGQQFLFLAAIAVFIITQVLLYSLNYNQLFFNQTEDRHWKNLNKEILTGDIFFTGDTFGKYGLMGCDRIGSISRRATILKKFTDYLYVDFGNFTMDNPQINKTAGPILLKAYRYMDLKVMNLTKRDLLNLTESNIDNSETSDIHFVSANLHISAPHRPANANTNKNIHGLEKLISTCQLIPLRLKNNKETQEIFVGITGISNNERKLHCGKLNYDIKDIRQSLEQVMPILEKADIRILLFNETFFQLKRLLMDGTIRFDLVIAYPTLPEHINGYTYIKNTPVVFPDEYGRSLGHVRVYKKKPGYEFKFNWYELGMGIPEDKPMTALTRMIRQRISNSKNKIKNREPVPASNTMENNNEK
jgi:hypothetical protein